MVSILVAVAAATALPLPQPEASPVPLRQQIGVNIHFTGAPARDLDLIAQAGFGWVRMDLFWERVERRRGEYRFEPYDRLLDGLDLRGIRALFILDYSNPLYEEAHSVRTEAGRKAFARFAGAAAERYRGRGVRWEIWNEPNLDPYWSPQPSVKDYIELVRVTSAAVRAADPQATIVAPATSGFPWRFLEQCFAAGMLDSLDAVSVHPYRDGPPETATRDFERLRRLIAEHARGDRPRPPMVSGEWGYSTAGSGRVSDELQARYLARQFLTNVAAGVELSIWYDWINDGDEPTEREHHYGAVHRDHRPKPAFQAARVLSSVLGAAHFVRRIEAGPNDHLLLFSRGPAGPSIVAAWTAGAPHDVVLLGDLKEEALPVTQLMGEKGLLRAQQGTLALRLTDAPSYFTLPETTAKGLLAIHSIELLPLADRVVVDVQRVGAGKSSGRLKISAAGRSARESVTLSGAGGARVELPVRWRSKRPSSVKAEVIGPDSLVLAGRSSEAFSLPVPLRDWGRGPDTSATPLSTRLGGDDGVAGTAEVSPVPPAVVDGLTLGPAQRLRYRFAPGWRFVRVVADAGEGRQRISGRPRALSVWVHGDASSAVLRCRFRDATGETFQPAGEAIWWTGWQRVELPLDGTSTHFWGGDQDGVVDYPIVWDSLLLVDPSPEGGAGELQFASPLLVYDAS